MVLSLLGVAIGLGNYWRFPYMMGSFGGGAFLAIYLLVVVVFGVPAMLAELALGRATRRGPVGAFERAGFPGGRSVGMALFVAVAMAMTYYLVVLGWILAFVVISVSALAGYGELGSGSFATVQGSVAIQMVCSILVAAAAAMTVSRGVRQGIESISKLFLPAFALLTVLLALWSLSLPGAGAGVSYLLTFDWQALTPQAVLAAVGQAFFSLGLGGTFLVIYGSYLPDDVALPRRALMTAGGDVLASMLAALVVIPMVFAYGLSLASGPPMLFEVLPTAFGEMTGGALFGALFFFGLGCIAFLSGVAAIEVLVSSLGDTIGMSRRRAAWAVSLSLAVLGIPAMLSIDYIVWSDLLWGSTMQPAGSVAAMAAFTWGLGRRAVRQQLSSGAELPLWLRIWYFWVRFVVPVAVLLVLASGWII